MFSHTGDHLAFVKLTNSCSLQKLKNLNGLHTNRNYSTKLIFVVANENPACDLISGWQRYTCWIIKEGKIPHCLSWGPIIMGKKTVWNMELFFHNSITVIFNVLIFCSPHLHNWNKSSSFRKAYKYKYKHIKGCKFSVRKVARIKIDYWLVKEKVLLGNSLPFLKLPGLTANRANNPFECPMRNIQLIGTPSPVATFRKFDITTLISHAVSWYH